jgi:hypothetical protein
MPAQAQAQGRRGGGELLLLRLGALQGLRQPLPQLLVLLAELLHLPQQGVPVGAGRLGLLEGVLDLGGVVVNGLATTAGLLRLLGNRAVTAEQGGGGVADPSEQR